MNDTKLDHKFFVELSAFIANAREEGFSFKPSQIVKSKAYCSDVLEILSGEGSKTLYASAVSLINSCNNLVSGHNIAKMREAQTLSSDAIKSAS